MWVWFHSGLDRIWKCSVALEQEEHDVHTRKNCSGARYGLRLPAK
jgi:hypothetical protein